MLPPSLLSSGCIKIQGDGYNYVIFVIEKTYSGEIQCLLNDLLYPVYSHKLFISVAINDKQISGSIKSLINKLRKNFKS
jgi:hypothetical protein